MIKKTMIHAFVRSVMISAILMSILFFCIVPLANNSAVRFKLDLLNGIIETGDLSLLNHPSFQGFDYYYIEVDAEGRKLYSSKPDTTESAIDFENRLIQDDLHPVGRAPWRRFLPNEGYDTKEMPVGNFMYTIKKVKEQTGNTTYHILFGEADKQDFDALMHVSYQVSFLAISIIAILACLEIAPILSTREKMKRFMTVVSHEIKTPITAIMASLHLLRNSMNETASSRDEIIEILDLEVRQTEELIQNLFVIVRSDHKQKFIRKERLDLVHILSEVYSVTAAIAREKGVNLLPFTPREQQVIVYADKLSVKMIVSALLKNAVQYTPALGNIEMSLVKHADYVEIIISDDGIGIDRRDRKRIVKKFYQKELPRVNEGLGIGLYAADLLVKAHKGKLSVDESESGGTMFVVKLPIASRVRSAMSARPM